MILRRNSLIKVCKMLKIRNTYRMRKDHMLYNISRVQAAIYIQRHIRKHMFGYCYVNDIDPISLEPINMKQKEYIFIKNGKHVIRHDPIELAKYIAYHNVYEEPLTRMTLSDDVINKLNTLNKKKGIRIYPRHEKNDALLLCMGLERQMGQIMMSLTKIMESSIEVNKHEMQRAYSIYSVEFEELFYSLYNIDCEYALHTLMDFRSTIKESIRTLTHNSDYLFKKALCIYYLKFFDLLERS